MFGAVGFCRPLFLTKLTGCVIVFLVMRTLNLVLVGTTPILLHRISRHQLRDQIASNGQTEKTLEQEVYGVMSQDEHGNPAVPVSWLWGAIRTGCSRVTVNGKQPSFFKLQSAINLPNGHLPLRDTDNKCPVWKTYSSIQHASPGSKRSIIVVAPKFGDWRLALQISVNEQYLDDFLLQRILNEAGKVVIGLFHPPKKQFGQFRVSILWGEVAFGRA